MINNNIKAPYECMELKEYKLSDFIPEFSEFRQSDDLSRFGCENIADNLYQTGKKEEKTYFKNRISICPSCKSKDAVKNGTYERKLIFLRIGEPICTIQKYKCKKNAAKFFFYTDFIFTCLS